MNKPTTVAAEKFLNRNPTFIGTVNGTDLYEHPIYGDENPLIAITADGRCLSTGNWELPSAEEGVDLREG